MGEGGSRSEGSEEINTALGTKRSHAREREESAHHDSSVWLHLRRSPSFSLSLCGTIEKVCLLCDFD